MADYGTLTQHIARQTMQLKDVNMCMSYINTIWRDTPLLIMFDNFNRSIISTFFNNNMLSGDLEILTKMVDEFLNNT
jgi:hypothetical protein